MKTLTQEELNECQNTYKELQNKAVKLGLSAEDFNKEVRRLHSLCGYTGPQDNVTVGQKVLERIQNSQAKQ